MIELKHGTYAKLKKRKQYSLYSREPNAIEWLWAGEIGTPKDLYIALELFSRISMMQNRDYAVKEVA